MLGIPIFRKKGIQTLQRSPPPPGTQNSRHQFAYFILVPSPEIHPHFREPDIAFFVQNQVAGMRPLGRHWEQLDSLGGSWFRFV